MKLKNDASIMRQRVMLPTGGCRAGWVLQVVREVPIDLQVILGGFFARENWVSAHQLGDGKMLIFFDPIVEPEEESQIIEEIIQLFEKHGMKMKFVDTSPEKSLMEQIFENLEI